MTQTEAGRTTKDSETKHLVARVSPSWRHSSEHQAICNDTVCTMHSYHFHSTAKHNTSYYYTAVWSLQLSSDYVMSFIFHTCQTWDGRPRWTSLAMTEVKFQQAKCSPIPQTTIKQNNNAPNEFSSNAVETAQCIGNPQMLCECRQLLQIQTQKFCLILP